MMSYTVQSDHPVPVVNIIVLNENDELLLTRRIGEPYRGTWILPSGKIDVQDDSAEAAAVREIKEELGADVELTHVIGVGTSAKDPRFFVAQVVYAARIIRGTPQATPEVSEYRWTSMADAFAEDLAFNHRELLAMAEGRNDAFIPIARTRYAEHYGTIFPYEQAVYPRFACLAVIVNSKKEIVLAHRARNPFRGTWDLPGGHLYVDETLEDCLRREVKEELGVSCRVDGLFQVYSDKGQNPKNADVAAVFFATLDDEAFEKNVEMDDFGYFPLDRLPDQIAYQNRRIIEDVHRLVVA